MRKTKQSKSVTLYEATDKAISAWQYQMRKEFAKQKRLKSLKHQKKLLLRKINRTYATLASNEIIIRKLKELRYLKYASKKKGYSKFDSSTYEDPALKAKFLEIQKQFPNQRPGMAAKAKTAKTVKVDKQNENLLTNKEIYNFYSKGNSDIKELISVR